MKKLYTLIAAILSLAAVSSAQCPTTITATPADGCGIYTLHLNEFPAMGNIIWTYDDGNPISSGSNNILWASMSPGIHTVCAEAWTGECPNGITICLDIDVPVCNSIFCPSEIAYESVNCGAYIFSIPTNMVGYAMWDFGDGSPVEISENNPDHLYTENGTYIVSATFYSELCPLGVNLTTTVNVECQEVNCPTQIWSGPGDACGVKNFEIGSFVEGESVIWYPGDETGPIEGGHFLSHTYTAAGTYTVCAYYTSPICPDGVELCTTIYVEECNTNNCPSFITSDAVDCDTYVFHINESSSGYAIWNFGDGSEPLTWQGNPEHSFSENGVYVISATYYGANCQEGVTLNYTVDIACESNNCPLEIWNGPGDACGVVNFEIASFVEGESVIWYPGDETGPIEGGHFLSHTYAAAGTYTVCAYYTSPICPDGVELCTTIYVEECNANNCPTFITSEAVDCDTYVFHINESSSGYAIWNFGDGSEPLTWQGNPEHSFAENGVYVISATYYGANCQEGVTLIYTVDISCESNDCPTQIWSGPGDACGVRNFEIGSFVEGESVIWYPGDETGPIEGGHFLSHSYAAAGTYTVCAYYTSPICPDGVELCTTIYVEECNANNCPTFITSEAVDCDTYVFHINESSSGYAIWNFGDGSEPLTWQGNPEHSFSENGVYVISATYYGANCQEGVTLNYTIEVSCNSNECPSEIWSGPGETCGLMLFEAGGFVSGESFIWYFGDESGAVEGGHYITHQYATAGTYIVNCVASNDFCEGYQLTTTITVEECSECTNISLGIDSYVNNGGTSSLVYSLYNETDQSIQYFNQVSYTADDPYFDESYCLPDGCYILTIDNNNPLNLGSGVNIFIMYNGENLMDNAEILYQDDVAVSLRFGVNSDCGAQTSCEAAFEVIYTNTPGHIEFVNNSVYEGSAQFVWSYGDGQISDGTGGNVYYQENGTYYVCLSVITATCENTYCQNVVVENMEPGCEDNEVLVTVTAEYSNELSDLIELVLMEEDIVLGNWSLPLMPGLNQSFTACIPNGCYSVELNSDIPINADMIAVQVSYNDEVVDLAEILQGQNSAELEFGLNADCTVGINEVLSSRVLLFPNPTQGNINLQSDEEISSLMIYDLTGKLIMQLQPRTSRLILDLTSLASGIYTARVVAGNAVETIRFEVSK